MSDAVGGLARRIVGAIGSPALFNDQAEADRKVINELQPQEMTDFLRLEKAQIQFVEELLRQFWRRLLEVCLDLKNFRDHSITTNRELLAACEEFIRAMTCPSRQLADQTKREFAPLLPQMEAAVKKGRELLGGSTKGGKQ